VAGCPTVENATAARISRDNLPRRCVSTDERGCSGALRRCVHRASPGRIPGIPSRALRRRLRELGTEYEYGYNCGWNALTYFSIHLSIPVYVGTTFVSGDDKVLTHL